MNILLIQSSLEDKNEFCIFPAGLAAIAANIENHNIKAIDLNVVNDKDITLSAIRDNFHPDVIGISLRNIDNQNRKNLQYYYRQNFQPELKLIRKIFGYEIQLIAGGSGFSLFASQIMLENPEIDLGVFLEGEEILPSLLDNLSSPENVKGIYYRKNGKINFTGKSNLPNFSSLPMPRRDLFELDNYDKMTGIGIQTSRGCVNKCSYCTYPQINGNRFRYRKPSDVADEIEHLKNKFGITHFFFTDASFGLARQHSRDILNEIIKRNISVEWGAYFDLNADRDFLMQAKKAGCRSFIFSPDGFSDIALKNLNKNFSLQYLKQHIKFMQHSKEFKDCFKFYMFLISSPGESYIDYIKTIINIYLIKIKSMLKLTYPVSSAMSWIRIEPGTRIYREAQQQNDIFCDSCLLPAKDSNYNQLFYVNPKVKILDRMIFTIVKNIHKFINMKKK